VARKISENLMEKKKRLIIPKKEEEWKELNDKLEGELLNILPLRRCRKMPSAQLHSTFSNFLYKFISDNISQIDEEPKKKKTNKRLKSISKKMSDIRSQKRALSKQISSLKKAGKFKRPTSKILNKLRRKLLKKGNKLRKTRVKLKNSFDLRRGNSKFKADPHKFAQSLYEGSSSKGVSVTKSACDEYFPNLYKDPGRHLGYKPLPEMISPDKPTVHFKLDPPSFQEFVTALKKKRNGAAPGKDGITYKILKNLECTWSVLYTLIQNAWKYKDIPECWSEAFVVLLYKDGDPKDPSNYRPIAITSCIGKIYFSLWAGRLESFMVGNGYFNRAIQKGFLSQVSGCSEHVELLKATMKDAKKHQRQLVITWIDLKNAFGSVSHNLIQFALKWYHVPEHFAKQIFKYYETLVAAIETKDWKSESFAYEIGVFQGCVISPLLFNMVFNLLLDLLVPLSAKNGYKFKNIDLLVLILAYADDLSVVAKSAAACQETLNLVDYFLKWTRTMAAKPRKCKSLGFKEWVKSDEHKFTRLLNKKFTPFDPKLTISEGKVGFIADKSFKFLGWNVHHHMKENKQKNVLKHNLEDRIKLTGRAKISGFGKLWLYQHYIVSSLAWPLMVYDLDITFVRKLERYCNKFLKKWAGIFKNGITSLLYKPRPQFGLGLTSLVHFYKRLLVNRSILIKYSKDESLVKLYAHIWHSQKSFVGWRPAKELESIEPQIEHQFMFAGQTDRKGLGFVPGKYTNTLPPNLRKTRIQDFLRKSLFEEMTVLDLPKGLQANFLRYVDNAQPFDFSWEHLIGTPNPTLIRWVLNATINSVVTPDTRKLWGFSSTADCPLCDHKQCSLSHILAGCTTALEQHRYTWRHDSVLLTLDHYFTERLNSHNSDVHLETKKDIKIAFVEAGKPPSRVPETKDPSRILKFLSTDTDWKILADLKDRPYLFPVHICVTNLRPDLVMYSTKSKKVLIFELTCPLEENILKSRQYKRSKYTPLKHQIKDNGWNCTLITIEIGARGFVANPIKGILLKLGFLPKESKTIIKNISRVVARCSFAIYKCHKIRNWGWKPLVKIV
jgi:hypothetical protein